MFDIEKFGPRFRSSILFHRLYRIPLFPCPFPAWNQRNQSIKHLNSHTDTIFPTQTIRNCHFPEHLVLRSNLIQLHGVHYPSPMDYIQANDDKPHSQKHPTKAPKRPTSWDHSPTPTFQRIINLNKWRNLIEVVYQNIFKEYMMNVLRCTLNTSFITL